MNLRSLNSFAGGMARGIDAGSTVANRKKLTDIAEGRFGLEKAADAREDSKWATYKAIFDKHMGGGDPNGGQFAEGAQNLPAAPVQQPSITQQAVPNAQSFMAQQPASPFAALQQPRKLPPFMDGPLY